VTSLHDYIGKLLGSSSTNFEYRNFRMSLLLGWGEGGSIKACNILVGKSSLEGTQGKKIETGLMYWFRGLVL
jgi:hypothetical protein